MPSDDCGSRDLFEHYQAQHLAQERARTAPRTPPPDTNVRVTEYQVSCLPLDGTERGWGGTFTVHVQWSGIGDLWAVRCMGRVYDAAGVEEYEPLPSSRDDEFLARFRHDLATAMRIAHQVAPLITVNGTTAALAAQELAAGKDAG